LSTWNPFDECAPSRPRSSRNGVDAVAEAERTAEHTHQPPLEGVQLPAVANDEHRAQQILYRVRVADPLPEHLVTIEQLRRQI
jgi:hypothetical protein